MKSKCDLPRHFLCLKGIISMDFSKGAMFVCCLGRFAETSGDGGGGAADVAGLTVSPRADDEVPSGESQQTPTSLSDHCCFIGDRDGRSGSARQQQTKTHSSSRWAVCGGRGASVCEQLKPDSHIRVILLDNFTSTCDIGVAVTHTLMRAAHHMESINNT